MKLRESKIRHMMHNLCLVQLVLIRTHCLLLLDLPNCHLLIIVILVTVQEPQQHCEEALVAADPNQNQQVTSEDDSYEYEEDVTADLIALRLQNFLVVFVLVEHVTDFILKKSLWRHIWIDIIFKKLIGNYLKS